jgi:hypothetical protein
MTAQPVVHPQTIGKVRGKSIRCLGWHFLVRFGPAVIPSFLRWTNRKTLPRPRFG